MYSLPNTVSMITLRRTRSAGHIVRMVKNVVNDRYLLGKPEGKKPLKIPIN
jgi:hypothetical protein